MYEYEYNYGFVCMYGCKCVLMCRSLKKVGLESNTRSIVKIASETIALKTL